MVCEMLLMNSRSIHVTQAHSQGRDYEGQSTEDRKNRVQPEAIDDSLEEVVQVIEESGRQGRLSEGDTTHGQEDDRPVERVEVLLDYQPSLPTPLHRTHLGQNAGSEEGE